MLLVEFGLTEQESAPDFVGHGPFSPGYIMVSQQSRDGNVVSVRYDILHLVMDLLDLMSGLTTFFINERTKHYSFSSSDLVCNIQLDRRKRSMIHLHTNDSEGIHPETVVLTVFQKAAIRFFEDEYKMSSINDESAGFSINDRDLDREIRRYYRDFLTVKK